MVTGESKCWIGTNNGIISLPYDPDNLSLVKQYTYQYNIPATKVYNTNYSSTYPIKLDTGLTYPDDISEYKKIRFDIDTSNITTQYNTSSQYNGTVTVDIGFGAVSKYDYMIYEGIRYVFNPILMTSFTDWHLTASMSLTTHNWYPLWNNGIPNIACYYTHNTGSHSLKELVGYITPYSNNNSWKQVLYRYIVMRMYDQNSSSTYCTVSGTIKLTMKCYR